MVDRLQKKNRTKSQTNGKSVSQEFQERSKKKDTRKKEDTRKMTRTKHRFFSELVVVLITVGLIMAIGSFFCKSFSSFIGFFFSGSALAAIAGLMRDALRDGEKKFYRSEKFEHRFERIE